MFETKETSKTTSSQHSENFSLRDFFDTQAGPLSERVLPFVNYLRQSMHQGKALYSREIQGPASNRVLINDPLTRQSKEMIMLGSNNYLGLANHPYVKEKVKAAIDTYGVGMGGPPLLNGMSSLHRELEKKLAALKGAEDCMLFASGFQANLGWVNGLLRDGDLLLYDELNHASLYDGIQLTLSSVKAKAFRFKHNDVDHLKKLLERAQVGNTDARRQIFVAVEGVYSMDGDLAPLREIRALCDEFDAVLVVDDAHGTGVMGETGRGTAEHFGLEGKIDLSMGTFSKSFGTTGGFLCGAQPVIDYLRYFSRSYLFSAHLPPPIVATVLAGLEVIAEEPQRIRKLHENSAYLEAGLNSLGFKVKRNAAIIPIMIPERVDFRLLSRRFHEEGIFLNSVEYPAVPLNEQRLRLSVMATHTREDLDTVCAVFKKLRDEFHLT